MKNWCTMKGSKSTKDVRRCLWCCSKNFKALKAIFWTNVWNVITGSRVYTQHFGRRSNKVVTSFRCVSWRQVFCIRPYKLSERAAATTQRKRRKRQTAGKTTTMSMDWRWQLLLLLLLETVMTWMKRIVINDLAWLTSMTISSLCADSLYVAISTSLTLSSEFIDCTDTMLMVLF